MLFGKIGSSSPGSGSCISMGYIIDKINEIARKVGVSTI